MLMRRSIEQPIDAGVTMHERSWIMCILASFRENSQRRQKNSYLMHQYVYHTIKQSAFTQSKFAYIRNRQCHR